MSRLIAPFAIRNICTFGHNVYILPDERLEVVLSVRWKLALKKYWHDEIWEGLVNSGSEVQKFEETHRRAAYIAIFTKGLPCNK